MNILGAMFPLGNFIKDNNSDRSIFDDLKSSLSFSRTCLLSGDADQCFRSLLFQAALSYASIGKRIDFYTPLPIKTIPSLVHKLIPNYLLSANLQYIHFHYLPTLNDVYQQLVHVSCDIIIIDGYLEFPLFKREDLFKIASSCALFKDIYEYLQKKIPNDDLILLCSCTCSESHMINIKQQGLFDLSIYIDMLENGDYHADIHSLSKTDVSCSFNFRIGSNEIVPLFSTVQHFNK